MRLYLTILAAIAIALYYGLPKVAESIAVFGGF